MTKKNCCACEGHTLDRLLQPTVMAILAKGPQHRYALLGELSKYPMLGGQTPDSTGVYRLLKTLENQGLVRHQVTSSDSDRRNKYSNSREVEKTV